MRDFAKVSPKFWMSKPARKLRTAGPEALALAMYLLTCPHSNFLGLYTIPLEYIALDMGMSLGDTRELLRRNPGSTGIQEHLVMTVTQAMQACIDVGFCDYDVEEEVVWVYDMAFEQLGDGFKPTDKRQAWLLKEVAQLPDCRFLGLFYKKHASQYRLPIPEYLCDEAPSGGHVSPFEAPSGGHVSSFEAPSGGHVSPFEAPSGGHVSPFEAPSGGHVSPFEAPSKLKERERDINKNILSYPPIESENQDRARDIRSGQIDTMPRGEEPGDEFRLFRKFYDDHVKPEGPRSGFGAYKQARASQDWPGVHCVMHDIRVRLERRQWNQGFAPNMQTYLSDRYYIGELPLENPKTQREKGVLDTVSKMAAVANEVLANRNLRRQ